MTSAHTKLPYQLTHPNCTVWSNITALILVNHFTFDYFINHNGKIDACIGTYNEIVKCNTSSWTGYEPNLGQEANVPEPLGG